VRLSKLARAMKKAVENTKTNEKITKKNIAHPYGVL
jgi:hypothetical protein